jgi:hypothetical protein
MADKYTVRKGGSELLQRSEKIEHKNKQTQTNQ